MGGLWQRPLPVGKTGKYTFTEDADWLGSLDITTITTDVPSSGVTVVNTSTDGKVIEFTLTGVTTGRHAVHFEFETTGVLSGCYTGYVTVVEC